MADNTELNLGSGGDTIRTEDRASFKTPVSLLDVGGSISEAIIGDAGVTLPVDIGMPGTLNSFGHVVMGFPHNQIDIQFYRDTPGNLVTVTTANGGSAASSAGGALFSTSANVNGEAKGVSAEATAYRTGSEVYCLVTAAFTTGVASSYQRIGLYDDNNGFFIGYEGTSFGVTVRNNTSDSTVAKGSFSEDSLTGAAGSKFTRDGTPEAIDLTKSNVYRIRFGWLGSAPISWEVLAPDGNWVTFHKTKFPNLQVLPSIRDADLPITVHVNKTSADATDLQIQTQCWGAGVTTDQSRLDSTVTDATLATVMRTVIVANNGASYSNISATTAGNLKVSLQEISDGLDVGAGNAGSETQRVSISTDDVNLAAINTAITGVAHDAVDSGNPHKLGARATTSVSGLTPVANADRTDLLAGSDGVLIVRNHASLEDIVSGNASNTDGSSTECIASQGAGVKVYLTAIEITNSSASDIYVEIKDGATTKWTMSLPSNGGNKVVFDPPLEGTAATAWNFDPSAAASTVFCSMNGFKSKV